MKKIISVVGARPNFMKMAPLHKELLKYRNKVKHIIVHTGQHYNKHLSEIFFKELELPKPDINLNIGSMSHAEQTAAIMVKFEKIILKEKPDLVLVYGDVNSTLAATLVCSKILQNGSPIPTAHIEAGLRSKDTTMPEEINRIVTDRLTDYLFVPEEDALVNLKKEGVSKEKIFFVGNIMIDSLVGYLKKAVMSGIHKELCLSDKKYCVVTLHRPSNVDSKDNLKNIIHLFKEINKLDTRLDIVFPIHPRTQKMLQTFKLENEISLIKNLVITEPLGYIDFLSLNTKAAFIITDSGGIQEETSYLNIPCLTLRENTERPITVTHGSNILCGYDYEKVMREVKKILTGKGKRSGKLKFYDGKTAERITKVIMNKILK